MAKIIRRKCFETNSSSTHSISIDESSSQDMYLPFPPDENGQIVLSPYGEYGWGQDTFNDVRDKIDYMHIYVRDWAGDSKNSFKETLTEVIKDHSGADSVELRDGSKTSGDSYSYFNDGYIDHQSVESRDYHYVFEDREKLRSFLFAPNSYFETDNDNH